MVYIRSALAKRATGRRHECRRGTQECAMPLSFLRANILKDSCLTPTSNMPWQWCANLEGQRSHECERGTQECVRHRSHKTKSPYLLQHLRHLSDPPLIPHIVL